MFELTVIAHIGPSSRLMEIDDELDVNVNDLNHEPLKSRLERVQVLTSKEQVIQNNKAHR